MDLSLESALKSPGDSPGRIAGRPLDFHALRVNNKMLLGQLVLRVLARAMQRAPHEPQRTATELSAEEMDSVVTEWFANVLERIPTGVEHLLSTRGRLALLLADMPGRWQDQFLRDGPWPNEFVEAMQDAYLRAGPDFQLSQMTPRPLDLGPIATLTKFGRVPYLKMVLTWIVFTSLLIVIFYLYHRSP
jgi:hypothetical protein